MKDRIDLHVVVPRLPTNEVLRAKPQESSHLVRERVCAARKKQAMRYQNSSFHCNQELSGKLIRKFCVLKADAEKLLETALEKLQLSARATSRVLKVSRTLADLAGRENIEASDIAEALQFRENS